MKRKYVDVVCLNDKTGFVKPLYLLWDKQTKIPIIQVKEICPCASLKVGDSGLRYTCIFNTNQVRHLFYERGKWFVEQI